MLRIIIPFPPPSPSGSEILNAVRSRTGLADIEKIEASDGSFCIAHPHFDCEPVIVQKGDGIHVIVGVGESSYILLALLSALVDMGGTYRGNLPAYAECEWDSLSEIHAEIRDATLE